MNKHISIVIVGLFIMTSCGGGGSDRNAIAQSQITDTDNRAMMFTYLPQIPGSIMFIGDSNTQYCEWHELLGVPIKNRGIAGQGSAALLSRIRDLVACQPDKVFIMIGTVDVGHGVSPSVTIANYNMILDAINDVSPSTQIYVESVLPMAAFANRVVELNSRIQSMCQQRNVYFINHYPAMSTQDYTYDGTHLTGEGYVVLGTVLSSYL